MSGKDFNMDCKTKTWRGLIVEKKSIYLAGTVTLLDYRRYVNETYHNVFKINDPLILVESLMEITPTQIVEKDIELIDKSDLFVAYIEKPTFGTVMEIVYAYSNGKPIFVINPNLTLNREIWLRYHTTKLFDSIDECFGYINEHYNV